MHLLGTDSDTCTRSHARCQQDHLVEVWLKRWLMVVNEE